MKYELGSCFLQDLLDKKGWSQQDLADRMGWQRQQVSDYCTNTDRRKRMSLATAISVADTLGVDIRQLYELKPVPIKPIEPRRKRLKKTSE